MFAKIEDLTLDEIGIALQSTCWMVTVHDMNYESYAPGTEPRADLYHEIYSIYSDLYEEYQKRVKDRNNNHAGNKMMYELGEPGYGGNCWFLFQDKPHRCPSCYVSGRLVFNLFGWRLYICRSKRCNYIWGGRSN